MNYHPFATIDMNRRFDTIWYRSCLLNNKRRYNFSHRIKHKTKIVNKFLILKGEMDEEFPD